MKLVALPAVGLVVALLSLPIVLASGDAPLAPCGQQGGSVVIEIADDGRGLDCERIRCRAVEAGMVPPDAVLGDDEIAELIFSPGLSTADQVTEVSGRGVGMDVVRSNIAGLGGAITTTSRAGC